MILTEVIKTDAKYDRTAQLTLIDDKVVFDCSNEEYGPVEFPLDLLISKLKEHETKTAKD